MFFLENIYGLAVFVYVTILLNLLFNRETRNKLHYTENAAPYMRAELRFGFLVMLFAASVILGLFKTWDENLVKVLLFAGCTADIIFTRALYLTLGVATAIASDKDPISGLIMSFGVLMLLIGIFIILAYTAQTKPDLLYPGLYSFTEWLVEQIKTIF